MRRVLSAAALSAAVAASAAAQQTLQPPRAIDPADIDSTCRPCENFYKFAVGGWERRTPIPAAFSSWSSFDELTQRNYEVVRAILEGAARDAETTDDADRRRVGRFYASCMDTVAIEARGWTPIRDELARIDRITTRAQLRDEIVRLHRAGRGAFFFGGAVFGVGATADPLDSRREILSVSQGGIGLPDRD